ncbi:MAG: helix-turn-helix domain-containing protein [Candidatus Stygibacter australis]|nr:helix-turn-helix domain-containing protein [Candidatus Stygibacter australis]MDP8322931.1 helix-turn-helix domain-containing protein [Candidatus Stygibacter australis]
MDNEKKDEILTEERILTAAIEEFIQKGYAGTRMQAIADRAKISKSALHYYYRHKERLFRLVLDKTAGRTLNKIHLDMSGLEGFREKFEYGFRYYYQTIYKNIKVVNFVFMELKRNPAMISTFLQESDIPDWIESLNIELEKEYQAGRIRQIRAEQLIINIVSLCLFPHLSQGIACEILNIDEKTHKKMLREREGLVLQFIKDALYIEEI